METLRYYVDLLIAVCGFDGSEDNLVFGLFVVGIAALIVVYAFYQAIAKTLWPGETDTSHIKYRILNDLDEDEPHAY